jgi:hypothetical protein
MAPEGIVVYDVSRRHVRIEAVADGVWAVLHREGGWAVANAGIVDLGDATLLFDALSGSTPSPSIGRTCAT